MPTPATPLPDDELLRIRRRLRFFFSQNAKYEFVDELTSDSIVALLTKLQTKVINMPMAYAQGIASHLLKEHYGRHQYVSLDEALEKGYEPPAPDEVTESVDDRHPCVLRCARGLPEEKRKLLMDYHAEGKNMENRAALAKRLGIGLNALQQRISKIKKPLRKCIADCLGEGQVR